MDGSSRKRVAVWSAMGKIRFTQGRGKFNMTFELEKLTTFPYLTSANSFHTVLRSINISET